MSNWYTRTVLLLGIFCLAWAQTPVYAQNAQPGMQSPNAPSDTAEEGPKAPKEVEVQPVADDATIAARLRRILQATQWFEEPQVRVREGVVFLDGRTSREQYVEWAGALARNTQGVVAVVNRIALTERSIWSLAPALEELHGLVAKTVQALPFVGFGLIVLGLSWMIAKLAHHVTRRLVHRRLSNALLRNVTARAIGVLVFLVGLYIVLRVSGLTRLALTVIGGTGIAGLVLGIAFRDIMENFLASILISMQHPFRAGDLVEVAGYVGLVQQVTTRGTVLMSFEGNHIQIPNATVYKSVIRNYSANPNRREDFTVGIGYEDAIATAQEVAMQVLTGHPAVFARARAARPGGESWCRRRQPPPLILGGWQSARLAQGQIVPHPPGKTGISTGGDLDA